MNEKVLITGASGLVGSSLVNMLIAKGYEVNMLSRFKMRHVQARSFVWNPELGQIDPMALHGVRHIVNLAGAGIADQPWSAKRKKEIVSSRLKSIRTLKTYCEKLAVQPETFVSASAVGIYGSGIGGYFDENAVPATDFLGHTCKRWEDAADEFDAIGARVAKLRIGIVLSNRGGALPKMAKPVLMGLGAALGTGRQVVPWVHIDDLLRVFVKAIEDVAFFGTYNVASPNQVTNAEFMAAIAAVYGKRIWLPNVPSFAIRAAMGEMATIVLDGNGVSVDKLQIAGFRFAHPSLTKALLDLLTGSKMV